jgi:hypothetical protein
MRAFTGWTALGDFGRSPRRRASPSLVVLVRVHTSATLVYGIAEMFESVEADLTSPQITAAPN